ncbi:response regulator transcription factor [Bacillus xiapuensis]|uniref:response regulator transcription factor n=1 Tax=Bacillus xiapuensis TaxID=2014075 RepID=UPI000C239D96|nr:response regulator transcription factor [Bacillus xiapuensis]
MNEVTRKPSILIIDDDSPILELIKITLEKEGFRHILMASSGKEAMQLIQQYNPHIIVLDVMLPDTDGFSLCNHIRTYTNAPVLFLTAKNSDLDKLQGFSFGGDDYITKPFNPLEVAARIKAHLKRAGLVTSVEDKPATFDFGHFQVEEKSGKLIVNQKQVECPAQEFKLLLYFCNHPNQLISKQKIYREVWGEFYGGDSTVMVHIRRLREKIEEDPSNPAYLKTVRGLGYILDVPNGRRNLL